MLDVLLIGLGLLVMLGAIVWMTRARQRPTLPRPLKGDPPVGQLYTRGYARPPKDPPRRYSIESIPERKTPPKRRWRIMQLSVLVLLAMLAVAIWLVVAWLYH